MAEVSEPIGAPAASVTMRNPSSQPMVLDADGGWVQTCTDQEHADHMRKVWDREVPECGPHRVSWEPLVPCTRCGNDWLSCGHRSDEETPC